MNNLEEIHIWDVFVRVFHWSLAAIFFLNFLITEDGGNVHEWLGYLAVTLIFLRVVWGVVSRGNANFKKFWPTKQRIKQHLHELRQRNIDQNEGHNPVGGLMILLLMSLILLLGLTGYMLENVDYFWGSEWLEELHESIANLTGFAVGIHVAAVLLIQKWTRIELIRPMWSGKRRLHKKAVE